MLRLIQEPSNDSRLGLPACVVGGDTIVWVGLDRGAVDALINDCGQDVGDEAIVLLRSMVERGDINLTREFMVTATVTMSGTVSHTVDAESEDEAAEKVLEMINDGEGLDDFMDDAYCDDVSAEDVEAY